MVTICAQIVVAEVLELVFQVDLVMIGLIWVELAMLNVIDAALGRYFSNHFSIDVPLIYRRNAIIYGNLELRLRLEMLNITL